MLCDACPLYRAIVIQNKHLRQLYAKPQPTLPEVLHVLDHCPKHLDRSYVDVVPQLEHILPNSRNLDYLELNQLISMAPYILIPSFPSVQKTLSTKAGQHVRSVLVDVGANNFYGCVTYKSLFPLFTLSVYEPVCTIEN